MKHPPTRMTLVVTGILSGALLSLAPLNSPAAAVGAANWQAGNIISDAVFTNKAAMSVPQIQAWLDKRLQNCDYYGSRLSEFGGTDYNGDGSVTRAEYGRLKGNPAPFTCLNNYYEVPKTTPGPGVPANSYGKPTRPVGSKSAAQLIYDAAQAYNISPHVLLVKLGTESAGPLTSDTWPFKQQYTYAMGAHCPDSGPGGSANCDSDYAGFSIQMREAAKLLRWYLDSMSQSWWAYKKPYQTNYILWNVYERGCGGSNVYIRNKATAALYTYTPYQPNQASLNAYPGTGNNCSSYGNRNFWFVFNNWFGSTHYTTRGAIGAKHTAAGGNAGALGLPQMNEWCSLPQNGCYQRFEDGSIYWTNKTGAWIVRGGIRTAWGGAKSVNGPLRYPVADELSLSDGTYQEFQGGRVYWSATTGAHSLFGGIAGRHAAVGGIEGYLGYPSSEEILASNGGVFQEFEGGNIYWSNRSGAWNTRGAIQARYLLLEGTRSVLGYPVNEEQPIAGGSYQEFEYGSMYWSSATGARPTHGAINTRYALLSGPGSALGYPIDGENKIAGGVYQGFENGRMYWSAQSGAWPVEDDILSHYSAAGDASGALGYPMSAKSNLSNGVYQAFENGLLFLKSGSSAQTVRGAIQSRYMAVGGASSFLGYPTGPETMIAGGVYQAFENGRIYWSPATGAHVVAGGVLSAYLTLGAEASLVGYPTGPETPSTGGTYQQFSGGRIFSSETIGTHVVRGGILGKYLSTTTDRSRLGFPTSTELANPSGGVYQSFSGGTIYWNDSARVVYD